ncbi:MAG: hypothetical protein A3J54_03510 [Candidatus Ryanbacteria bacterium RIFCSPHIGHO2_02_FULL_45_13b]|uniref:Uncharacterized protein n=1 Tax=Candidatus Ryanbacteria bacterium RIFCSPHIGHO2_02_FULL_45_13b TaxID=1802117 RepID=A0A1G2G4Q2_9BACT|nr:MAG: hypothetical protein A3J54_03510 [Candidatus Ryanbacteria bacterium RIFCSPHIGHO2_02_FULL_45_13b]
MALVYALFCEKGHLFAQGVEEKYGFSVEEQCPCGTEKVTSIPHYGDVNDCQDVPLKKIRDERLFVRVQGLVNKSGEPLEGYVSRVYEVWDVSSLF